MRAKTLVLSAALGIAGLATVSAQVYSVNAVGYINLTLKPGFQMIANQLDNGSGNQIGDILTGVPDGTFLYKFNGTSYDIAGFDFGEWDQPTTTMAPGEGAFLQLPPGSDVVVTLVGEVPQGTGLTVALPAGFSIVSPIVPMQTDLSDAAMAWPGADGDFVYRFNVGTQNYDISSYDFGDWDVAPVINVGESFFVQKVAATSWVRDFSVN